MVLHGHEVADDLEVQMGRPAAIVVWRAKPANQLARASRAPDRNPGQVAEQGVEGLPVRLAAQHYYANIIQESGAVAACFHDGVYRSKLGRSRLLEEIPPEMHRATFCAGRKKLF